VITSDLRRALAAAAAAAGLPQGADPGLRPAGGPGRYAASVALSLGRDPRAIAHVLAGALAAEPWIESAEVTGPGYLTITVTPAALAAVAERITRAGLACAASGALAGRTVAAPPHGDPLTAATWEKARAGLAAQLTAGLAAAAGATLTAPAATERLPVPPPANSDTEPGEARTRSADSGREPAADPRRQDTASAAAAWSPPREADGGYGRSSLREATAFAGRDAVVFTLARAIPGRPLRIDPRIIARHVPGNPAYAVRYAHARAASGVRWGEIAALGCLPADPAELALLDVLSWLPERVATAARRDRPDEFARYLEDLASVTIDVLTTARDPGCAADPGDAPAPGSDRLSLASAARTGLAAGLGLLGVSAPDRL
jgi:arginyl-tRNA synthetase